MTHDEAFLQDIKANPEDDPPRLIYADWLDDQGKTERAEFIRVHVAWCRRVPETPPDEELRQRLLALWESIRQSATGLPEGMGHAYDRGFVAGVHFQGYDLIRDRVEEVCHLAPVRLSSFRPAGDVNVSWLSESPLLASWTGFCCFDSAQVISRLLASPHLASLQFLHLQLDWVESIEESVHVAEFIASTRQLERLIVLDLNGLHIGDEGLATLAAAEHLHSLRKLTMRSDGRGSHDLGEAGIRALTTSKSLTQLTHLGFRDCTIDGSSLRRLLSWDGAAQLRELDLAFTDLLGEDVVVLAQCPRLRNLRRLSLSAFELSDAAVEALAKSEQLPAVAELQIEAEEEYGEGDDQTPELLHRLVDRFGPRLTLATADTPAFELTPLGEADRIWRRLQWFWEADEARFGMHRIL